MPIIGSFSGQYGFGRGGGLGVTLNPGEAVFTRAGSYAWVAPAGVTSVSVVCIGGGGAGGVQWSSGGGGGGGLGWKNNIPVIPGSSYTVVVGAGGSNGVTTSVKTSNATNADAKGDTSYFIDQSTVAGYGSGRGGPNSASSASGYGGGYTGDGGGRGGDGGYQGSWNYGGAGAGGYNGRGASPEDASSSGANAPSGSGGGGTGGWYSSTYGVPAGGGTGIYGRTNDGVASGSGSSYPNGGYGGSGGGRGVPGENTRGSEGGTSAQGTIFGGFYGGGGGGSGTSWGGGSGGCGVVRIMWGRVGGQVRSFPTAAAWAAPVSPATDATQLRYEQEAELLKNIGCPQLWYKNSDISTIGNGGSISTWQNSGSYGPACDLVNNQGPYYGGTVTKITDNGRAAANFAGSQYMRFRNQSSIVLYGSGYYQTWSLFVVYRDHSQSGNFGFLGRYGADGTLGSVGMMGLFGSNSYAHCYNNDGFPVILGLADDTNWIQRGIISSSTNSNNQSNYSFSDNGVTRTGSGYYSQGTGDNNLYYFDGYSTNRTSPNGGPTSNGSGYGARLDIQGVGTYRNSANNGYLAELMWFDRSLNDAESTAVRKYLNSRLSV